MCESEVLGVSSMLILTHLDKDVDNIRCITDEVRGKGIHQGYSTPRTVVS